MVQVMFIDGTAETFEVKKGYIPWEWDSESQTYSIISIEGHVVIPSASVKMLKHIEVDIGSVV